MKKTDGKKDIFISYRRDGGAEAAHLLYDKLTGRGYSVFFDVKSLREGAYDTRLEDTIRQCTDFILVLSPGALDRCWAADDWVRREIELALACGKNIIPVMLPGFAFPPQLPESVWPVCRQNAVEFSNVLMDAFVDRLVSFLCARPSLWQRLARSRIWQAVFGLTFVGCVAAALFLVFGTRLLFPILPGDTDTVNDSIAYTIRNLVYMNDAFALYEEALEQAGQFAEGRLTAPSREGLLERFDKTRGWIAEDLAGLDPLPDELSQRLAKTPLDQGEFAAMYGVLRDEMASMLDRLDFLELCFTEGYTTDSTNARMIQVLLEGCRLSEDLYFVELNSMYVNMPDRALRTLKTQYLPELTAIADGNRWDSDTDSLKSKEETLWNQMQKNLNDYAAIVGDQQRALDILKGQMAGDDTGAAAGEILRGLTG